MMFKEIEEETQAALITACLQSNKRLKILYLCILGRGPSIIRGVCFPKAGVFEYKPRETGGISVFISKIDIRHFHQSNTVSSA